MVLTTQRIKDHCLIIVGDGGEADQILARRRMAAGGRFAHFLTKGPNDSRVRQQHVMNGATQDAEYFTWQPPSSKMPLSSFAKKFSGRSRSFWTKLGPDGVELEASQQLTITSGVDGNPRHLELWDEDGNLLVQMSGEITVDIDKQAARTMDVEVYNPEFKAFGTFSWRFVWMAMLLQMLWQMAKFLFSIQLEQTATAGEVPWFRGFMTAIDWCIGGSFICIEMWSWSLTGMPATPSTHALANLASLVVMMVATYFQMSEFVTYVCGIPATTLVTCGRYYFTMEEQPTRRLIPHLVWTIAQAIGTTGSFLLFATIAQIYALLLSSGFGIAASIFLSFATAIAETGSVICTRLAYDRFVHKKRDQDGQGPVVGDQTYLACVAMIISAHGFAEACRICATFAGAVSTGGFTWIITSTLSVALNLSARLGWSRYVLIQFTKWLWGGPTAMKIFAPSGWSKFHDEQKIYCGYFRFVFLIGFVAARAIAFPESFEIEGFKAPVFNLSATILIPVLMLAEILEDETVTREWLPVNPAGPGLLKVNARGNNADPAQLITLEHLPDVDVPEDPWKMFELKTGRSSQSLEGNPETRKIVTTPSLSLHETSKWASLRGFLGQQRAVNSAPSLHGLRELPFMMSFSFAAIVANMTSSLIALLLGTGYMRGICTEPLDGINRILGILWWDVPLPCN